MKNFTVLYKMPLEGLQGWMQKPEEERKAQEDELKAEWDMWLKEHSDTVLNTIGLGKTKSISAEGITDTMNGLMLSSYVAAESLEAATELFTNHPHLKIPGAVIEVMEAKPL